jgi:hypothetical protein
MIHTSASDVTNNMSMVLGLLGPLYAIVFGIMGAKLLINKGLKKIFPNYNPNNYKRRSRGSRKRTSPSNRSTARNKSKKKEVAAYLIGAKAPLKRSQRTTIFMGIKHNAEVHKVRDKVLGDKTYISYDNYSTRTADGRPKRTNIMLHESRNVKLKQVGKTLEISYD